MTSLNVSKGLVNFSCLKTAYLMKISPLVLCDVSVLFLDFMNHLVELKSHKLLNLF